MGARSLLFLVTLGIFLGSCATQVAPQHIVRGNVLRSTALPAIEIEIDPSFRYIGRFPFRIRDIAAGERILFADLDGVRVKRLFIAQFEGFLPHTDEIYRYDFSNAEILGGHRFRHNIGAYSSKALLAQNPSNEATKTHEFLRQRGLQLDDEVIMSRFLTLGSEERRAELILFYIENASDHGVTLSELQTGSERAEAAAKVVAERSRKSFAVIR